jgi:hypothetical protein
LTTDPVDYVANNPNRKIGMLLGTKAGDVIWYFKTDTKKGVSINPKEIDVQKYKEILMSMVKDALEILRYGSRKRIVHDIIGIRRKSKRGCRGIRRKDWKLGQGLFQPRL